MLNVETLLSDSINKVTADLERSRKHSKVSQILAYALGSHFYIRSHEMFLWDP